MNSKMTARVWFATTTKTLLMLAMYASIIDAVSLVSYPEFAPTRLSSQEPATAISTRPQFETVSIKPVKDCNFPRAQSPPGLSICGTTAYFIRTALINYADGKVHPFVTQSFEGGPSWINSTTDAYWINAKADHVPAPEVARGPMLQSVLEDRFKLKAHFETREVPAFDLSVSKSSAKLQPFVEGSCIILGFYGAPQPPKPGDRYCGLQSAGTERSPIGMSREIHGIDLDDFCIFLSSIVGRPVINKTELARKFDFYLKYSGDTTQVAASDDTVPDSYPSIFAALQQQLGLTLTSSKGPGKFLVIDQIEKPKPD